MADLFFTIIGLVFLLLIALFVVSQVASERGKPKLARGILLVLLALILIGFSVCFSFLIFG